MEEKIKIEVPLLFVGEAPAIRERGGILVQNMNSLEVECLPANMPHSIEVDLSVLADIDQAVHVKDLHVDGDVTIVSDPEKSVVQIARSRVEAEIETEELAKVAEVEEAPAGEQKGEAAESAAEE